jgi:CPA1 family monovalent cation:H+ antiporter
MATIPREQCPHLGEAQAPTLRGETCNECGLESPTRVCLSCGHIGCCESTNGHATAHARATGHPLIRSLPLSDQSFTWCYSCQAYLSQ